MTTTGTASASVEARLARLEGALEAAAHREHLLMRLLANPECLSPAVPHVARCGRRTRTLAFHSDLTQTDTPAAQAAAAAERRVRRLL
jgi:hypothetical protein